MTTATIQIIPMAQYPVSSAMINLGMPADVVVEMRCAEHLMAVTIDRTLASIAAEQSEQCKAAQLKMLAPIMIRQPSPEQVRKAMNIPLSMLERRHKVTARIALLPLVSDPVGWLRSAFTEARNEEWPLHRIEALADLMPFLDIDVRRKAIAIMLETVGQDNDMDEFRALAIKEDIIPAMRYVPENACNLAYGVSTSVLVEAIRVTSKVIVDHAECNAIIDAIKALRDQPALSGTLIS